MCKSDYMDEDEEGEKATYKFTELMNKTQYGKISTYIFA